MADYENSIFGNLPQRRRGAGVLDDERPSWREVLSMRNFDEGPLPPRPHSSGKGGPSINQGGKPPVVTSVWSAADAAANAMTLSNGGLTATATLASWNSIRGTIGKTTGKLYFEVVNSVLATSEFAGVGFATADTNSAGMSGVYLGNFNFSGAAYLFGGQFNNAGSYNYGFGTINAVAGDVLSVAIDLDAGRGWIAYNNVWQGSGNPATGANPAFTVSLLLGRAGKAIFPGMAFYSTGGVWTLQPTAASQKYAPPSGFSPWG